MHRVAKKYKYGARCGGECDKLFGKNYAIKNIHDAEYPGKRITKASGLTTDGYVWIYVTDRGPRNQYKLHRYLMELKIGRILRSDEIVHHINGNKLDNTISNLEITTISEHNKIHGHFKAENRTDVFSSEEIDDLYLLNANEFVAKHGRNVQAYHCKKHRLRKEGNTQLPSDSQR